MRVDAVTERLKQIICEVCAEREATIEALEVISDHVYLVVSVDPQFGIHRLVRLLSGAELDRDTNAALNILRLGRSQRGDAPRVEAPAF